MKPVLATIVLAIVIGHAASGGMRNLEAGLARSGDVLVPLADLIPLGRPVRQVLSPGDVATYLGVILVTVAGMRPDAGMWGPREPRGSIPPPGRSRPRCRPMPAGRRPRQRPTDERAAGGPPHPWQP